MFYRSATHNDAHCANFFPDYIITGIRSYLVRRYQHNQYGNGIDNTAGRDEPIRYARRQRCADGESNARHASVLCCDGPGPAPCDLLPLNFFVPPPVNEQVRKCWRFKMMYSDVHLKNGHERNGQHKWQLY